MNDTAQHISEREQIIKAAHLLLQAREDVERYASHVAEKATQAQVDALMSTTQLKLKREREFNALKRDVDSNAYVVLLDVVAEKITKAIQADDDNYTFLLDMEYDSFKQLANKSVSQHELAKEFACLVSMLESCNEYATSSTQRSALADLRRHAKIALNALAADKLEEAFWQR